MNPELPEDEDLARLEERLRSLRPAEPSPELLVRLRDAWTQPLPVPLLPARPQGPQPQGAASPMLLRDWTPLFATAAALLAVLGLLRWLIPPGPAEPLTASRNPASAAPAAAPSEPPAARPVRLPGDGLQSVRWNPQIDQWQDDGIIVLEDGRPYRKLRVDLRDEFLWEQPDSRGTVRAEIPRQERLLIPIETY